jgi:predicted phage terminase large subunit-like protein
VDLNYSTSKRADYSVAFVLGTDGETFYALDVRRMQTTPSVFRAVLAELQEQYDKPTIYAYVGGQEGGILDLFAEKGLHIEAVSASSVGDKFVRAQPAAAAWNQKRILLPREARWLAPVVDEIVSFTGVRDRHDDVIDALAAAFDAAKLFRRRKPGDPPAHSVVRDYNARWPTGQRGFG